MPRKFTPFRGVPPTYSEDGKTATIPLTQGLVAIVDAADADRVSVYKWHAYESRGRWYARRVQKIDGKITRIKLHRFILEAPDGIDVDHRDGDGLNCRRENIRLATEAENARNRRPQRPGNYKGVCWMRRNGKWGAYIGHAGKQVWLGLHKTPEDAARAYDDAARRLFGEFARTNF